MFAFHLVLEYSRNRAWKGGEGRLFIEARSMLIMLEKNLSELFVTREAVFPSSSQRRAARGKAVR